MFEWIKSEFNRFKKWLLVTACLNSLLLFSGVYFDDYEHSGVAVGMVFTILYGINALLLGWLQMKAYRSVNMWTYLINRPVKIHHMCLALVVAGTLILTAGLVLPYVMVTLFVDLVGLYIVDWRHYLQAVYIFWVALSFYLTASYITLSGHKAAFAVLILPVIIIMSLFSGGPVTVVAMMVTAWLILMLLGAFKASLNSPRRSAVETILTSVPFHLAALMLMSLVLAFVVQAFMMLKDGAGIKIAWNKYFANDIYEHLIYTDNNEKLILGLDLDSTVRFNKTEDLAYYQRQINLSQAYEINKQWVSFPRHQQLPFLQNYQQLFLSDTGNGIKWIYSHNKRQFLGRKESPGSAVLGHALKDISSEDNLIESQHQVANNHISNLVFDEVPRVLGHQVITTSKVYFYDKYSQQLNHRIELSGDEYLLSGMEKKGSHYALLSSEALYLLDPVSFDNSRGLATTLARVPLPKPYENLNGITWSELLDSNIISFLYGKLSETGQYSAEQITYSLDNNYQIEPIGQRALSNAFSTLYRYRGYYLSPFTHVFYQSTVVPFIGVMPPQPPQKWHLPHLSPLLWTVMIVLSLCAVILSYYLLRKRVVSKSAFYIQMTVVAVTSLSGLLFCWLFYASKEDLKKLS